MLSKEERGGVECCSLNFGVDVDVAHHAYLALEGGRAAYVDVGKRDGRHNRIYTHPRGHSSAARRGLRADTFVILAYTRQRPPSAGG